MLMCPCHMTHMIQTPVTAHLRVARCDTLGIHYGIYTVIGIDRVQYSVVPYRTYGSRYVSTEYVCVLHSTEKRSADSARRLMSIKRDVRLGESRDIFTGYRLPLHGCAVRAHTVTDSHTTQTHRVTVHRHTHTHYKPHELLVGSCTPLITFASRCTIVTGSPFGSFQPSETHRGALDLSWGSKTILA